MTHQLIADQTFAAIINDKSDTEKKMTTEMKEYKPKIYLYMPIRRC